MVMSSVLRKSATGVLVDVLAVLRRTGLVQQRQADLGEVDELDAEALVPDRQVVDPGGDGEAAPAGAGTATMICRCGWDMADLRVLSRRGRLCSR
jgi:hypothetical protein